MNRNGILDTLKKTEGVHDVFIIDDDLLQKIYAEEESVGRISAGMRYENRAMDECMVRDEVMCVFCDPSFEPRTEPTMLMEDECGHLVGFDVPLCKRDRYACLSNTVWLSDDFVMFTNVSVNEVIFVMVPQRMTRIGPDDGICDPIMTYPSRSTDELIRRELKVEGESPRLSSAIVAFDWCRSQDLAPM